MYKQILINAKLKTGNKRGKKYRADWEKSIKEEKEEKKKKKKKKEKKKKEEEDVAIGFNLLAPEFYI